MTNREALDGSIEGRSTAHTGRGRLIFAQIVVALVVLTVYLPTAVAGARLAVTLVVHPGEIAQRPWWANLWGGAGVGLIAWLAWKNRDLAVWVRQRALGRAAGRDDAGAAAAVGSAQFARAPIQVRSRHRR